MELLERELGRLEGVRTAKVRGPTDDDMFYYRLEILESKPLLPSRLRKLAARLEDYPYLGMEATVSGTVKRSGDGFELIARGSQLRYALRPAGKLRAFVEAGKFGLTVSGKVKEGGTSGRPVLEVGKVRETPK